MKDRPDSTPPRLDPRLLGLGLLFLLVSIAASVVLVARHLDLADAPGCGEGSGCAQAAASAWGKVPLVGWPVSFVGLAYFVSLGLAWTAAYRRGGVTRATRGLVRLGAAMSLMFLVVMIAGGYACPYCIAAHAGNFLFLFCAEAAPRAGAASLRPLAWAAAAFAVVTGGELAVDLAVRARAAGEAETQRSESTERIVEATRRDAEPDEPGEPFTGRYRQGPERAPIRIVIISDYQCPDCKRIEAQARRIMAERDDVSLSAKHFPFCTGCNPHATSNMHPNACWAARAAETAGILSGNEGFWQMHFWLFDRGGVFTNEEITQAVIDFGYDPDEFRETIQGPETLARVQADIEEASDLGLHYTPMVFINGVELKGWNAPEALIRAVEEVAATNPPPADASRDQPPPMREKVVADWRDFGPLSIPPDNNEWTLGAPDAPAHIVLWGDYQEPFTARADAMARDIVAANPLARYTFRHYPVNKACNPVCPITKHPQACLAAAAAEAAGALGGNDAYWAMHEWLMANQKTFSQETLRDAAAGMGLDPDALVATMASSPVAAEIAADGAAAKSLGLTSIPFIFVNDKFVPRWQLEGTLDRIAEEAATAPAG